MDEDNYITLPFVLTKTQGGEYETEAFTAGWHLGLLDAKLTLAVTADLVSPPVILRLKWRQQADLIAMSHSLVLRVIPIEEEPEYGIFIFQEPDIDPDDPSLYLEEEDDEN